jgi:hypothetical protein
MRREDREITSSHRECRSRKGTGPSGWLPSKDWPRSVRPRGDRFVWLGDFRRIVSGIFRDCGAMKQPKVLDFYT